MDGMGFLYQILKGIIYLTVYISILLYSFKKAFLIQTILYAKQWVHVYSRTRTYTIWFTINTTIFSGMVVCWHYQQKHKRMNDNEIMLYFNKQQE